MTSNPSARLTCNASGRHLKRVNAKELAPVKPQRARAMTGLFGSLSKPGDCVFVRVLGVDPLTFSERETAASHADVLIDRANEMHLDPALSLIPDGTVAESGEVTGLKGPDHVSAMPFCGANGIDWSVWSSADRAPPDVRSRRARARPRMRSTIEAWIIERQVWGLTKEASYLLFGSPASDISDPLQCLVRRTADHRPAEVKQ